MTDEADALLERLPELLAQRPQLRYRIYDILAEKFVEREEFNRILAELKASREESNRHFQQQLDELKASREESNRRFEALDRRFEALQHQIDRRYEDTEFFNQDTRHFVNVVVGGFQRHAGSGLEDAVAGTLRVALKTRDLDPSTLRLRQKVLDAEGVVGPPGRSYEYDIMISNGRSCIFEVKSVPDEEDVQRFADKCELITRTLKLVYPRKVIITLAKTAELAVRCDELGIELP